MVGGATALLSARRLASVGGVVGALVAYYLLVDRLWQASLWWDIAWLDVVLLPVVFSLVWLVLPVWRARGVLPVALAFAAIAVGADVNGLPALPLLSVAFLAVNGDLLWRRLRADRA